MRPRLLDLFCGAGGATRGYQLAGFHVTGVDISEHLPVPEVALPGSGPRLVRRQAHHHVGAPAQGRRRVCWGGGDPVTEPRTDPGRDRAMLIEAIRLVTSQQFAAKSNVQRKMRIGWGKTLRLFELMESWGVIGPSEGTFAHDVLVTAGDGERLIAQLAAEVTDV